ncbi:MAG: hypothetical protein COB85_04145 [Bacteroidetes bacterium]|nr:MAG: hypothetical protein COB85_04145 [Bacteroidota bacterium]
MKNFVIFLLIIFPVYLNAQTILITDNFDSYNAGSYLGLESSLWTTWDNMPGTATDAFVSDEQAASGTNSVKLESPSGGGPSDILLPFASDYTQGAYELALKIYVDSGKGAYYNIQTSYKPGVEWAMEVYFAIAGTAVLNAGGTGAATFNYTHNTWIDLRVIADLDNDEGKFYVDDSLLHTWTWSSTAQGGKNVKSIGSLNIYASGGAAPPNAEAALYYVDDVVLTELLLMGLNDLETRYFKIYPNPVKDYLQVEIKNTGEFIQFRFLDLSGRVVSTFRPTGQNIFRINLSELPSGMYIMEATLGTNVSRKKILVK